MRVDAVVVTFNRRALLVECLDALRAQTHPVERVFVVDNASTDGTAELLAERDDVEVLRLERNTGSSGGFAAGIERARSEPSDWIWIMDDDAEPEPDSLERALAAPPASDPRTVALAPKVLFPSGALEAGQRGRYRRRMRPLRPEEYVPGRHLALGYTSFVGTILRTGAARRVALPKAEFFIWGDDIEYSLRLRRAGEIRLVPESVVRHKGVALAHSTRRSRVLNRLSPVTFAPTPIERFWQNLFGLRNHLWTKREHEGQGALSAAGTTLLFVVKHALWDDRPLTRLPWILRFARDGRRGRFTTMTPAQWNAEVRRRRW